MRTKLLLVDALWRSNLYFKSSLWWSLSWRSTDCSFSNTY